tara:strand:+ start:1166 stop:2329 length:1164 start_codon:yes stop_codon:yes gene_type:complete
MVLPFSSTDYEENKLENLADVNFTGLSIDDQIKYDGTNFINFSPTYLDGANIDDNHLIKVVSGATTQTSFVESSVLNTSTSLKTYIPSPPFSILAGSIETEIFNTNKLRMHLTTGGISITKGITITSDGRVGIGVVDPEEDLELDGNIQLDTGGVQRGRVIFYDKQNNHEHSEIDGLGEGTNGGVLAFYTKVDGGSVTEKLRINNEGAIGIEGANYGTTGSVLTSNGSGSPPSWNEPYYFGADITANQSVPSDSQVQINFVPYLPSPYDGNNGDMTAGVWTCPANGLYKVSLRVIVATSGDDIRSADIYIISNDGSDTYESGAKYFNSFGDDIITGTLACESLIPLSANDTIRAEARIVISSGGGRTFNKTATAGGKGTELIITRVI